MSMVRYVASLVESVVTPFTVMSYFQQTKEVLQFNG